MVKSTYEEIRNDVNADLMNVKNNLLIVHVAEYYFLHNQILAASKYIFIAVLTYSIVTTRAKNSL